MAAQSKLKTKSHSILFGRAFCLTSDGITNKSQIVERRRLDLWKLYNMTPPRSPLPQAPPFDTAATTPLKLPHLPRYLTLKPSPAQVPIPSLFSFFVNANTSALAEPYSHCFYFLLKKFYCSDPHFSFSNGLSSSSAAVFGNGVVVMCMLRLRHHRRCAASRVLKGKHFRIRQRS